MDDYTEACKRALADAEAACVDELLTPASLLKWCQDELSAVEDHRKLANDDYKTGILFGVRAVLTALITHFDLEGK